MKEPSLFEIMYFPHLQPLAEAMVEKKIVEGHPVSNKEKEIERITLKMAHDLKESQKKYSEEIYDGFQIIGDSLANKLSGDEKEKISKEMSRVGEILGKNSTALFEIKNEDDTFQDILHISDETMMHFYQVGCDLFEQNNFEEAKKVFKVITTFNPLVYDYWIALGTAEHKLHNMDEALTHYSLASILEDKRPEAHYFSSIACLEIGDLDEAMFECDELEKIVTSEHLESHWKTKIVKQKQNIQKARG